MEGLSVVLFFTGLACVYMAANHAPYARIVGRDNRGYVPGRDHQYEHELRIDAIPRARSGPLV